ncbi:MAG: hypothetical protein KAS75_07380 [Planctomycetes bacterium]|nr:hypothetical protein [Planctomycetota bacterium]
MNQGSRKSSSNYNDNKVCERGIWERNIFILSLISLFFGGTSLLFMFIMIGSKVKMTPLLDSVATVVGFLFPLIAVVTAACAAVLVTKREISGKLKSLVFVAACVTGVACVPPVFQAMAILATRLQHTGM